MGLTTRSFLTIFCLLILMAGCSRNAMRGQLPYPPAAPGLEEGTITLADGTPASMTAFLSKARTADYILLGEGHTSPCDHLLQSRFISSLAKDGVRFSVGMEMLSRDQEATVEAVNSGSVSLDAFPDAVKWNETWGYPYDLYQPVFEAIYSYKIPLYALNVPQSIVKKVSRGGLESLTAEERASWVPDTVIPPSEEQREALQKMLDAHRDMVSMAKESSSSKAKASEKHKGIGKEKKPKMSMTGRMDRFFLVQSLWDTAMAEAAIKARQIEKRPVVILAGAGHVENGWGLAHRLRILEPSTNILLVTPWRAMDVADPKEADLRFYCPTVHRSRMGFTLMPKGKSTEVLRVATASLAADAGFKRGDVITHVNDLQADSLWVLHRAAIDSAKSGEPMRFAVERAGRNMVFTIQRKKPEAK